MPEQSKKESQWDSDMATIIGAAPEPRTPERKIGRLAKFSDYDDPWGGDGTKLMPLLRAIHKTGHVKLAEDRPVAETEFQGLPIGIENPKGSVRSGVDKDGHEWRTKMKLPYGFIEGTKGKDGDSVDAFVGPDKSAPKAFVVHQRTADGKKYDEDKVFLGLHSKKEAKEAFLMHNDNPRMLGDIAEVSMERLQKLVDQKGELSKISQVSYYAMLDEILKLSSAEEQLRMGREVEKEHTGTVGWVKNNPNSPTSAAAERIAKDHLKELPDYYTRLKKMEQEGEATKEKRGWSWEGFKEGLRDEGIPLSGATIGAGLGAMAHKPLVGAALGYAGGSLASILHSKLKGEEPSTARKVLALSGLGYGMGGMGHLGVGKLVSRYAKKGGTAQKLFHEGIKGETWKHRLGRGLIEEGMPALGATGMTGVALATDKAHKSPGHVTPPTEKGAPVG